MATWAASDFAGNIAVVELAFVVRVVTERQNKILLVREKAIILNNIDKVFC